MADVIRDLLIRLGVESRDAERALGRVKASFTELNQGLELAQKAVGAAQFAFSEFSATLDRAGKVEGLRLGFEKLQSSVDALAGNSLDSLRTATRGLASDFELMQQANQAVLLGVDKGDGQYAKLAESATILAKSVGISVVDGLFAANQAIGKNSFEMLDNLGVTLRVEEAQRLYAERLDKTTKQLTAQEKQQAFSVIATQKIIEKASKLSDVQESAAVAFERAGVSAENLFDKFVTGFSSSSELAEAFGDVADSLDSIDAEKVGRAIADFTGQAIKLYNFLNPLIEKVNQLALEFDFLFDASNLSREEIIEGAKNYITWAKSIEQLQKQLDVLNNKRRAAEKETRKLIDDNTGWFGWLKGGAKKEVEVSQGIVEGYTKAIALLNNAIKNFDPKKLRDGLGDGGRGAQDAAKELKKLTKEYDNLLLKLETETLKDALDLAIERVDQGDFQRLSAQFEQVTFDGTRKGLEKFVKAGIIDEEAADRAAQLITDRTVTPVIDEFREKQIDAAKELADKQKEAFQESVDFFTDIFQNAIDGTTFNLEDTLKRIAVGFAAEMAASLTGGFSIEGGAAGIGQQLASSIVGNLGLGGGGAPGTPQVLNGIPVTGGAGAGIFGGLGTAALGGLAGLAAGSVIQGGFNVANGGSFGSLNSALLAPVTGGLSFAIDPIADSFGSGKSEEQKLRDALRDALRETGLGQGLEFQGVGGTLQFNKNVDPVLGNDLASQISPATNLLSALMGGGDDFGAILANAAAGFSEVGAEAENFNEVLVNTQSLMDSLGVDIDQTKAFIVNSFLDGKVVLSEFGAAIEQVNVLAQDNLIGEGSIDDALRIVAKSIDTSPRVALKGLELALKEASEVGITSMRELGGFLLDKLGPDARDAFNTLADNGINSFEDIHNASADQIFLIFSQLQSFKDDMIGVFNIAASESEKAIERTGRNISSTFRGLQAEAIRTGETFGSALGDINRFKSAKESVGNVGVGVDQEENRLNKRPL